MERRRDFSDTLGVRHGSRFDTRVSCGSPRDLHKVSLLLLYRAGSSLFFFSPIQSNLNLDVILPM